MSTFLLKCSTRCCTITKPPTQFCKKNSDISLVHTCAVITWGSGAAESELPRVLAPQHLNAARLPVPPQPQKSLHLHVLSHEFPHLTRHKLVFMLALVV